MKKTLLYTKSPVEHYTSNKWSFNPNMEIPSDTEGACTVQTNYGKHKRIPNVILTEKHRNRRGDDFLRKN